jgi:hypothetical protein
MTYSKKLKDPRWQRFRLHHCERANWRCEHCCASNSQLHVHHVIYLRGKDPWDYPAESICVLCDLCHKEWHDNEDAFKIAIATAVRMVPGKRLAEVSTWLLKGAL